MINIGTVITAGSEEFHVRDLLSSGGFGEAYVAVRKPANTRVVIKVPKPNILADPIWSQKFAREARILANIHHPHVVKILAYWEFPNGDKALVQELIEDARDLNKAIQSEPDFAPSFMLQALYALRAFHQSASPSVVHRDISPRNLLVNKANLLKVIDFGLAKEDPRATQILTVTGEWFGTPGCMSPEQASNAGTVDHRADLYALGRSFAAAIQNRRPEHVDCGRLREPWRTLCEKLTQHDEADRYQSAEEAIQHAQALFATHSVPIMSFLFHVSEHRHRPTTLGWWQLCDQHFSRVPNFQLEDLYLLAALRSEVYSPGGIDANAMFVRLESSAAIQGFEVGLHGFDASDQLGAVYRTIYPYLDAAHKLLAFRRLCKTAVEYHRYYLMDIIRSAYGAEPDSDARTQMMAILDAADPTLTVHGKGILPRVP